MFQRKIRAKDKEKNPERLLQLKRICDMLIAAGYFRARVPVLSPFDKVVGGLVWGITASNVDLDVDIIFQENSTIGERVKLSEQIVRALVRMKCPHRLQPQQIQGLDYPPLFKAIQWLVSLVYETRELTKARIRDQAEFRFGKSMTFPDEEGASTTYAAKILDTTKPQRRFRKQDDADIDSLLASAEATLLEFGERFYDLTTLDKEGKSKKKKKGGASGSKSASFQKLRGKLMEAKGGGDAGAKKGSAGSSGSGSGGATADEKRQEELRKQMDALQGGDGVSMAGVGSMIQGNADAIKEAMKQYEEETSKANPEMSGKRALEQQFKRQEAALQKVIQKYRDQVQSLKGDYTSAKQTLGESRQAKMGQQGRRERLVEELAKLDELESKVENKEVLRELRMLVSLNETLKRQEASFKEGCKAQRAELEEKLAALLSGKGDKQTQRMLEIERLYEADLKKHNKLRALIAKKNLQIARVTRQIDAIPTRAELLQYQRRFVELYDLVSNKLVETRKYFDMYNMLEEKHKYMLNEVNLLNSISDSVPGLMKTSKGKDMLLANFKKILSGMGTSQEQVNLRYGTEKKKLEVRSDKHKKLLQRQRKYFATVKEFQDECEKNEKLTGALESLEGDDGNDEEED